MGIRETRDTARRALHHALSVPAYYVTEVEPEESEEGPVYSEPASITVRLHTSFMLLGDLRGTSFDYAERQDVSPRMIFLASEVTPDRGGIVAIGPTEAWQIDNVLPIDGITYTAEVVRFKKPGFPYPGEDDD